MALSKLKKILAQYKIIISEKTSKIFAEAITHGSYVNEAKTKINSYERLEFLGDSVLNLIISTHIFKELKDYNEGDLTAVRAKLVKTKTLFEMTKSMGLNECIYFAISEAKDNGWLKEKVCADVYESVLGAIYLTHGFETSIEFVENTLIKNFFSINTALDNSKSYKSILQEKLCSNKINYQLKEEILMPNNKHKFIVEVVVDKIIFGTGEGLTKKDAESAAAREALERLKII